MRAAALVAVFAVLTVVSCRSKTVSLNPALVKQFPAVACSTLTEVEVDQLAKVLPTFNAALKAGKWSPMRPKEYPGSVGLLAPLIDGMNVPGVEESLKTVGLDWSTVRATLYKVLAASAALGIEKAVPPEQMKKDTSQRGKTAFEDFRTLKAACTAIPAANKEIVKSHQQELQLLHTLGK